nr:hypothetical protein [Tanacetum cinerariifolium]
MEVVTGGEALNLPLSRAKISYGDFALVVSMPEVLYFVTFNKLRIGDSVHEYGDPHVLRSSIDAPTLIFESLQKVFCGFLFSLLDAVNFYWILEVGHRTIPSQIRAASDASLSEFFEVCCFPFPTVFRTTDMSGVRLGSACLLMYYQSLDMAGVVAGRIALLDNDEQTLEALNQRVIEQSSRSFIDKYGTHIVVGVKMGGKDVIYLKQLQSSNLEPTDVHNLLKQLADETLSEHVSKASISGSDKSLKNTDELGVTWDLLPILAKSLSHLSIPALRTVGFLSRAISLYLRYKPPIEELDQFLEFQLQRSGPNINLLKLHMFLYVISHSIRFL